jgi:peptidoglycan/LPS O-acetylase OafA/YrhL
MRSRIAGIEAARGVAALAVVTFHWWVFHDRQLEWADAAGYGWLGVQLFFAISGFVLFLPYARGDKRLDLPSFTAGRFLRIVPAWWAAVVIGGIVTGTAWTWANAGELVFLQMWWEPATDPVPQGWTLCAEAGFYVVMPIIVVAMARYRPLQLPILLALVPVGWISLMELYHGLGIFTPLTWLDQFAWGMVAAAVVARGIRVRWWGAALAGAVGVWILADAPRHLESPYGWPQANLTAAIFAVIVAWLATSRFHVPRAAVWLGTVSYGVYLWHYPLLALVAGGWLWALPDPLELPLVILGSVALGWASWHLIEQPAMARRPRLTAWLRAVRRPTRHSVVEAPRVAEGETP